MNLLPQCILYTQDQALVTRVSGYLKFLSDVQHVDAPHELETLMHQHDPILLLFDLRSEATRLLLPRLFKTFPESLILAFGLERSGPAIEADAMGAYAVVSVTENRQRFQSLVNHALVHLKVVNENRMLRSAAPSTPAQTGKPDAPLYSSAPASALSLHHLSSSFQHLDDADTMFDNMVQGISTILKVSRIGLFVFNRETETYVCRAGVKCISDTHNITVSRVDPLVIWMQRNAHLVCRTHLEVISDARDRTVLQHSLDRMGAEIIIPLFGRKTLLGWLFVGHRATGVAFSHPELDDLMLLGEHVATTLENHELYERVAMQKALADTVFDSMPIGVIAIGVDGKVRWLNTAAQKLLDVSSSEVVKQPVAKLSSQLAGMLMQRIEDDSVDDEFDWDDPRTKRSLSILTRKLEAESKCIGSIAILRDRTQERKLRVKEEEVERASFWTELAAAMSHEVRNPLVAISTFAQLLPERYSDPDFREKFSELVRSEISRLNGMVDQISDFAEAPALNFEMSSIADIIHQSIRSITATPIADGVLLEAAVAENLPQVRCDRNSLTECFLHLIQNAVESVAKAQYPAVHVSAVLSDTEEGDSMIKVDVMDNGVGIENEIREKIFSPFCTTKARGIGLGLPIARRTVRDHGGKLSVEATQKGTSIEVLLPAQHPAAEATSTPSASSINSHGLNSSHLGTRPASIVEQN